MIQYLLLRALVAAAGVVPAAVLTGGAGLLGTAAWYLSAGLRATTLDHMRHVLGPLASRRECERAARGCVRTAARYWVDLARGPRLGGTGFDATESVDGLPHLFEAIERGCGVIVVSAHLGNPEAIVRAFARIGVDPLVLTEPLRPASLHALVHKLRTASGARFLPAGLAGVREAVVHVRAGGLLALLADRDVLGGGRAVTFFGERARLPDGPVELALRTGATLLPAFVLRAPGNRLRMTFEPPLPLPRTGDRAADLEAGHRLLAAALERGIGSAPGQWFALSPVWHGLADGLAGGSAEGVPAEQHRVNRRITSRE